MIGGPGCTTFPGNMSRKQERPKDFGSTDAETSASRDQNFDRWMGTNEANKVNQSNLIVSLFCGMYLANSEILAGKGTKKKILSPVLHHPDLL